MISLLYKSGQLIIILHKITTNKNKSQMVKQDADNISSGNCIQSVFCSAQTQIRDFLKPFTFKPGFLNPHPGSQCSPALEGTALTSHICPPTSGIEWTGAPDLSWHRKCSTMEQRQRAAGTRPRPRPSALAGMKNHSPGAPAAPSDRTPPTSHDLLSQRPEEAMRNENPGTE